MSTQPNPSGTSGRAPNPDELYDAFREIDAIHKHVDEHGCCCEELEGLIVDLWTRLVHNDRIWNRIGPQERPDARGD